jgi:hypothetical protein
MLGENWEDAEMKLGCQLELASVLFKKYLDKYIMEL